MGEVVVPGFDPRQLHVAPLEHLISFCRHARLFLRRTGVILGFGEFGFFEAVGEGSEAYGEVFVAVGEFGWQGRRGGREVPDAFDAGSDEGVGDLLGGVGGDGDDA